jgi:hypothetical protein
MHRFSLCFAGVLLAAAGGLSAQPSAAAAKCQVVDIREVGLVQLVKVNCPENRLSMVTWLPPHEKAIWLRKDAWVNVVPTGMGQDVHVSPGRAPRSDYSKPKPVHVLILAIGGAANAGKATATLLSLTFH